MDYAKTAAAVLENVGGESNIQKVVHCATRLRFTVKDHDRIDDKAVRSAAGVITTAEAGGQYQVVIGNDVPEVYAALAKIAKLGVAEASESEQTPKGNLFNRFIGMISGIFTPVLWALAGTGLLKAFLLSAATFGWISTETTTYTILFSLTDAFIYFIPIALAITAARYFQAQEFTSLAIAGALVYPSIVELSGASGVTFLGIPVVMVSYVSSVIPIIVAVWLQSHAERFLYAKLHSSIRRFVTPMIVVLLFVPAILLVIGPLASYTSGALAGAIGWVFEVAPWLGGALMGGLWQVFVIFGLHWGFVPVILTEYAETGYILLAAPLWAAVLAQAAAAAGVWVRSRDANRKALAAPATLSGFLAGITEPAIYGVNLPLKRPFAFGIVGGVIGGAIIAAGSVASNNPGSLPGLLSVPSLVGNGSFAFALTGIAVAVVVSFLLTVLVGFHEPEEAQAQLDADTVPSGPDATVLSPLDGSVVDLSDVPDPAFSTGGLGQGVAIRPLGDTVYAPFDGEIVAVFPTGHAIGLRSDSGAELLIHVGIDTVKLAGEHFTALVEGNQRVEAGQPLLTFDREAISAAGYDLITPVVVTNGANFPGLSTTASGSVSHGDALFLAIAADQATAS